ncbi:hypothetical protein CIK90_07865 [Prevotella sp. P5-126]|nr:hypothetical protein CIK90_07865 [Prevotella sp. P5-126]
MIWLGVSNMIWSWLTNMQIYKLIDSLPSFLSFFFIQNLKIFAFLDKQIKKSTPVGETSVLII